MRLGVWGISKKSHFRLQMVFCIHFGLGVGVWSANFCSFRGEGGVSRETSFFRFSGLLRTFAMAPYWSRVYEQNHAHVSKQRHTRFGDNLARFQQWDLCDNFRDQTKLLPILASQSLEELTKMASIEFGYHNGMCILVLSSGSQTGSTPSLMPPSVGLRHWVKMDVTATPACRTCTILIYRVTRVPWPQPALWLAETQSRDQGYY